LSRNIRIVIGMWIRGVKWERNGGRRDGQARRMTGEWQGRRLILSGVLMQDGVELERLMLGHLSEDQSAAPGFQGFRKAGFLVDAGIVDQLAWQAGQINLSYGAENVHMNIFG
jgi:hypothetical protein